MKIYVGVTDRNWFTFLRSIRGIDEVNFWQPSSRRRFSALEPGDLFLFKLHYPTNAIVGGGTFIRHTQMPAWFVWDAFREKNGASSFDEMRARIERYRHAALSSEAIESVGCIILGAPFFLPDHEWLPAPEGWSGNIVQGKTYDTATPEGAALFDSVRALSAGLMVQDAPSALMFGEGRLVRPRLGQGGFRTLLVDAYGGSCAVSGERALPVLEAAHILPVAEGGRHELANGLILRSDIHTLFDMGYVTITPTGEFRASRRLTGDYNNGAPYYALESAPVQFPQILDAKPSAEALQWHNDVKFLG